MSTLSTTTTETSPTRAATVEQLDQRPVVAPPVDIFENAQEVLVVADLPGVDAQGLAIRVDGEQLVLEGRRKSTSPGAPVALEHRPADYRRSFVMPRGIDSTKIAAELKDGVLRLRLPKAEAVKPRRIPVTTG
ncbi:MAG: Hsp20/alpha crystallin family protein [Deltaproteobacteria bacterium]|nr:Hsp20/alpha crystallin family protein [Deltaproteobacteria bacterium]